MTICNIVHGDRTRRLRGQELALAAPRPWAYIKRMERVRRATCTLCEASCGLDVTLEGDAIRAIRGAPSDVHSKGYICPKGNAIPDVQGDPDRVRTPLRKGPNGFEPIGWDEALAWAGRELGGLQRRHGRDAVAYYFGNPTGHDAGAILYSLVLSETLGSKNRFSSQSVDALPRTLASYLLYGSQALLPVPDVDRARMMIILGANPVVSNGSAVSLPNAKKRIKAVRERGRLVVIDPRRTETAALADTYLPIRPGTDALFLAAMLCSLFEQGLVHKEKLRPICDGIDRVEVAMRRFPPRAVEARCGIAARDIEQLARDFAAAESAVIYGRMGTCTQRFGALTTVLLDLLNLVTGNLDRPGGAMFTTPAVDLVGLAAAVGQNGAFDRYRSRVSGLPEFNGELPVAAFAEEIETEGPGQIRGLITHAGNPVLSIPGGRRFERALAKLDFMVSVDIYINETTQHADLILPPAFGFEHDSYPLLAMGLAAHNATKYAPAIMDPPEGVRDGWQILLGLASHILASRERWGGVGAGIMRRLLGRGPKPLLDLAIRMGPHGARGRGLTLKKISDCVDGLDLGELESRLPGVIKHKSKRIDAWPDVIAGDMRRLERELDRAQPPLVLISRRHLRSNNSWMHNAPRLIKGPDRCTLRIHPDDASARAITSGCMVELASSVGSIRLPAEVSDEMMPGVVSAPHGYGHDAARSQLEVASQRPGVSINDITSDREVDALSGCGSFAVGVEVTPVVDA